MKKFLIIGFLVFSMSAFSKGTCNFIKDPDNLLKKIISEMKKKNLTRDIVCDEDGDKKVYYELDSRNEYELIIGINIDITENKPEKGLAEIAKKIQKNSKKVREIIKNIDYSKYEKERTKYINIEYYFSFHGEKNNKKSIVAETYNTKTDESYVGTYKEMKEFFEDYKIFPEEEMFYIDSNLSKMKNKN